MKHSAFYSELIIFGLKIILLIVLFNFFNFLIAKILKLIIQNEAIKIGFDNFQFSRLDFRLILFKLSIQKLDLSLEKLFKMKIRVENLNLKLNLQSLRKRDAKRPNPCKEKHRYLLDNRLFHVSIRGLQINILDSDLLQLSGKFQQILENILLRNFMCFLLRNSVFNARDIEISLENVTKMTSTRMKFAYEQLLMSNEDSCSFVFEPVINSNEESFNHRKSEFNEKELILKSLVGSFFVNYEDLKVFIKDSREGLIQELLSADNIKLQITLQSLFDNKDQEPSHPHHVFINAEIPSIATLDFDLWNDSLMDKIRQISAYVNKEEKIITYVRLEFSILNLIIIKEGKRFFTIKLCSKLKRDIGIVSGILGLLTTEKALFQAKFDKVYLKNKLKNEPLAELNHIDCDFEAISWNVVNIHLTAFDHNKLVFSGLVESHQILNAFLKRIKELRKSTMLQSDKMNSFSICFIANLKGISIELPILKTSSNTTLVTIQSKQTIIKLKYQDFLQALIEFKQNQIGLGRDLKSNSLKIKYEKCVFEFVANTIENRFQFVFSPLVISKEFEFEEVKVQEERLQTHRDLSKTSIDSFIYTYAVNSESNLDNENEEFYQTSNEIQSDDAFKISGKCLYMIALQIRYCALVNANQLYSNQFEFLFGDIFGSIDLVNFGELIALVRGLFEYFYEQFSDCQSSTAYSSIRLKTSLTQIDLVINQSTQLSSIQSEENLVLIKIVLAPIYHALCDFHFEEKNLGSFTVLPILHLQLLLKKPKQSEEKITKHVKLLEHASIELNLLSLFNRKCAQMDMKRIEFWKNCDETTKRLAFLWEESISCACFESSTFFSKFDLSDFNSEFVTKPFLYMLDVNSNAKSFGESILISNEPAFFSCRKFLSEMSRTKSSECIRIENQLLKRRKFIVISHLEDDSEATKSKFELEEIAFYNLEINRFKYNDESSGKANKNKMNTLHTAKVWPPYFSNEFTFYIKYLPIIRNMPHSMTEPLNEWIPYSDLINTKLSSKAKKPLLSGMSDVTSRNLNEYKFNMNRYKNGIRLDKHSSVKENLCVFECFIETSFRSSDSSQTGVNDLKRNSNAQLGEVKKDAVEAQINNGLIFMTNQGVHLLRQIFESKRVLSTLRHLALKTDWISIDHLKLILNPMADSNESIQTADFDLNKVVIQKIVNKFIIYISLLKVNTFKAEMTANCFDLLLNLIESQILEFKLQIEELCLDGQMNKTRLDLPVVEMALTDDSSFFFALRDVKVAKFTSFDQIFLLLDHLKRNMERIQTNMTRKNSRLIKLIISDLAFKVKETGKSNLKLRILIELVEIEISNSDLSLNGSFKIEIFIHKTCVGMISVDLKKTLNNFELKTKFAFEEFNDSLFALDIFCSGIQEPSGELRIDKNELLLKSSTFEIQLREEKSNSLKEAFEFENFFFKLNSLDKTMRIDSSRAFFHTKSNTISQSLIERMGFVKDFLSSRLALNKIELKIDRFELVSFPENSKSFENKAILIQLNQFNLTQLVSQMSSVQIGFESEEKNEERSEILLISNTFDDDQFAHSKSFKHESISNQTQPIVKLPKCLLTFNYDNSSNESVRFDYLVNESSRFEIDVDILEFVYKEFCLKPYLKSKKENRNHLKLIGDERKVHASIQVFDLNEQIELNENKLRIFKSKYFFFSIHQLIFNQFFIIKFLFQKSSNNKNQPVN